MAVSQGAEKRCEFWGQIQQFLVVHVEKDTNSCCSNGMGQAEWGVISDGQVVLELASSWRCFHCAFQTLQWVWQTFLKCVLWWALNQRPSFHISLLTWLLGELIQGSGKEEQHRTKLFSEQGQMVWSIHGNSWFPTHILCIKYANTKNYSQASGFVCVTCAFPDFFSPH